MPEVEHPEAFTTPALHAFGRQDDVVGFEDGLRLRDHYPRGSFVVLDGAGHNVHLEQPEVTSALIRDWLNRIDLNWGSPPGTSCSADEASLQLHSADPVPQSIVFGHLPG